MGSCESSLWWRTYLAMILAFHKVNKDTSVLEVYIVLLCCCCSVAQSCPTLCGPVDYTCQASLYFTISWSLLKLMSIGSVMPSNHLIADAPFLSCPQSFSESGAFPMNWLFTSGGQGIGASASASVLPMNIQDRFPLGLTGLTSLQSKGLSRVFSNTTVQKHQFFGT